MDDGRVNDEITLRSNGDEDTFRESVRLFTMTDFAHMYEEAGVVDAYGDCAGVPYRERAPRLILHAVNPRVADGC